MHSPDLGAYDRCSSGPMRLLRRTLRGTCEFPAHGAGMTERTRPVEHHHGRSTGSSEFRRESMEDLGSEAGFLPLSSKDASPQLQNDRPLDRHRPNGPSLSQLALGARGNSRLMAALGPGSRMHQHEESDDGGSDPGPPSQVNDATRKSNQSAGHEKDPDTAQEGGNDHPKNRQRVTLVGCLATRLREFAHDFTTELASQMGSVRTAYPPPLPIPVGVPSRPESGMSAST
jgi:hypothetical protein